MVPVMEYGKFKRGINLMEQQDIKWNYHRQMDSYRTQVGKVLGWRQALTLEVTEDVRKSKGKGNRVKPEGKDLGGFHS